MDMSPINWLAVLAAGISAFVSGGVWYSPALFGNAWMADNQLDIEKIKKGNMQKIYGIAFVLSLIMAANLAMFLADGPATCPEGCVQKTDITWGLLLVSWRAYGCFVRLQSMGYLSIAAGD